MSEVNPDILDDVATLTKIDNSSVDEIWASHLLEHFGRNQTTKILKRWHEVLKPGGIIRISVPDFDKIVRRYIYTGDIEEVHGLLHAAQKNEYDIHYISFNFSYLKKCLELAGFSNVGKFNISDTDHWYVDDHSQSFLPHMDKLNGLEMSLNVYAQA
ncbi:MAG: class I SAM-dependent methyltransferase [Nitrososphaerales archaeon]